MKYREKLYEKGKIKTVQLKRNTKNDAAIFWDTTNSLIILNSKYSQNTN